MSCGNASIRTSEWAWTLSFGASAKWIRSPDRGFGDSIISGRGRKVHHEAHRPRQLGHFRAGQVLEAQAPGHDPFEIVDELHLAHERQAGMDIRLGERL